MKAMILAAGLGTRLKPFTDHHPKALVPVNSKPVLQRNIEYLQSYGITDVVINVHHFSEQIIDALKSNNGWGSAYSISDESDEVLETGGGLLKAKNLLQDEECFLLMNADMLTDLNLANIIAFHQQHNHLVTLAVTDRNSSRAFLFDKDMRLRGWQNKDKDELKLDPKIKLKDMTAYAFSGIHIINKKLFDVMSRAGKFSIVLEYIDLCMHHPIGGFNHSGGLLFDVGTMEKVAKAEAFIKD